MNLLCEGSKVRLLKDIWDDGEEHHPPGYIARAGELVVVRSVGNIGSKSIVVAHEGHKGGGFVIYNGEFEAMPEAVA